eukprot:TRINITY_DN57129_c0_g1_i1.p1 TRINITY_DN57129_c0_g1~~TRINITY_DN57129_c0_g1_i1.p1  ORF type:complete len:555 (+),score=105.57 TRINITY_DN57129_c0_g1_i1:186-1850(+)
MRPILLLIAAAPAFADTAGQFIWQQNDAVRKAQEMLGWCGPICADKEEQQLVAETNIVRFQTRPWEVLRYRLVVLLARQGWQLDWETMAELWETLDEEWPTRIFQQVPLEATIECAVGHLVLRFASAAANWAKSRATNGATPLPGAELAWVAAWLSGEQEALEQALCGGWPVFELLALMGRPCKASADAFPIEDRGEKQVLPPEVVAIPDLEKLLQRIRSCASMEESKMSSSFPQCIASARPKLEEVQAIQSMSLLGYGTCPEHSVAAWLDAVAPVPAVPLCVRSGRDVVSDTIKYKGRWSECNELFGMAEALSSPGCLVVDVGANLGACTLLLARLGFQVLAFEPLPSTVQLFKASLNLNEPLATQGSSEGWGKAGIVEWALGQWAERPEQMHAYVVEGIGNAGDSIIFPRDALDACNQTTHKCLEPHEVGVVSLDEALSSYHGTQVCLMKVDAQGAELNILRGAQFLLSQRKLGLVYFEWRPALAEKQGEEPMAILELFQAAGYRILAPMSWFEDSAQTWQLPVAERWVEVSEQQWPALFQFKGNLVAVPPV